MKKDFKINGRSLKRSKAYNVSALLIFVFLTLVTLIPLLAEFMQESGKSNQVYWFYDRLVDNIKFIFDVMFKRG